MNYNRFIERLFLNVNFFIWIDELRIINIFILFW